MLFLTVGSKFLHQVETLRVKIIPEYEAQGLKYQNKNYIDLTNNCGCFMCFRVFSFVYMLARRF